MDKKDGKETRFIELHQDGTVIPINRDSIRCVTTVESKRGGKLTRLILNRSADDDNMLPFYVDENYAEVLELLNQD